MQSVSPGIAQSSNSIVTGVQRNRQTLSTTSKGYEYADLFESAGIDSFPELAQRLAANLATKLAEVNEAKKLVRSVPTESQVGDWIAQAAKLDRIVTH